jgi:proprotein convertase subtilisin/kexin type 5
VVYYYYSNQCVINCPNSLYGQSTNNTCVPCNNACPLCYGPTLQQCYSCQPDNSTIPITYYYLSYGTNYCVTICPYGQYATNSSFTCQPCNINCATCYGSSTNCLTCTYVNTISIVYLYQSKCIVTCPNKFWQNSTNQMDHQCSPCNPYCAICTGPLNTDCSYCANQTVLINDTNVTVQYYKDLYSTTCNPTCPNGQYIDSIINNVCVPCNSACLLCSINSTNCFKCAFNFYLYVPQNSCLSNCPINNYNNPIITVNYYYCTQCTKGCYACTGPSLFNCSSCQNETVNLTTISYFKDTTGSYCVLTCSTGYYGKVANNNC